VTPDPTTTRCSGTFSSRVHLLPREDALPVGLRVGQLARPRTRGQQDHLGVEALLGAVDGGDDRGGPVETASARQDLYAAGREVVRDVGRLGPRQLEDSAVHLAEVDVDRVLDRTAADGQPELCGRLHRGHDLGRRDERLRRDAVREYGRTAEPVAVDERHLTADL
jgi:hypothetical protein